MSKTQENVENPPEGRECAWCAHAVMDEDGDLWCDLTCGSVVVSWDALRDPCEAWEPC